MRIASAISVITTSFAGGAIVYLQSNNNPQNITNWKTFMIGAVIAGVAAIGHLYQDPAKKPETLGEVMDRQEIKRQKEEEK